MKSTRIQAHALVSMLFSMLLASCFNVDDKSAVPVSLNQTAGNNRAMAILDTFQGRWVDEEDKSAYIEIENDSLRFGYDNQPGSDSDTYFMRISDSLLVGPSSVGATYIILEQASDTMQFELLGLSDSTFSWLYLPVGKIHVYLSDD